MKAKATSLPSRFGQNLNTHEATLFASFEHCYDSNVPTEKARQTSNVCDRTRSVNRYKASPRKAERRSSIFKLLIQERKDRGERRGERKCVKKQINDQQKRLIKFLPPHQLAAAELTSDFDGRIFMGIDTQAQQNSLSVVRELL